MDTTTTTPTAAELQHDYSTLLGVYDDACALRDHLDGWRVTAACPLGKATAVLDDLLGRTRDVVDALDDLLDLRHRQLVDATDAELALVPCVSLFDERVDVTELHSIDGIADVIGDVSAGFMAWSTVARYRLAFTRDITDSRDRAASHLLDALTLANELADMTASANNVPVDLLELLDDDLVLPATTKSVPYDDDRDPYKIPFRVPTRRVTITVAIARLLDPGDGPARYVSVGVTRGFAAGRLVVRGLDERLRTADLDDSVRDAIVTAFESLRDVLADIVNDSADYLASLGVYTNLIDSAAEVDLVDLMHPAAAVERVNRVINAAARDAIAHHNAALADDAAAA